MNLVLALTQLTEKFVVFCQLWELLILVIHCICLNLGLRMLLIVLFANVVVKNIGTLPF